MLFRSVREDRNAAKTASMLQDRENNYKSQHWDQPNVLAHLRMSDRTGPEGEKILHLEELQSDWGQQGRKKGFVNPDAEQNRINAYNKWEKARNNTARVVGELADNKESITDSRKYIEALEAENKAQREANEAIRAAEENKKSAPFAPYVSSPEGKHTSSWVDQIGRAHV